MMLGISFIFAILIEIFFPIALAFWITRRFKTDWLLIGVGTATFILSQVVHLPIVTGLTVAAQNRWFAFPAGLPGKLINAILLGFLAGICEEPARWLGYKFLKSKADSWKAAVTLGVGHGGIESIGLVGLSVFANLVLMILVSNFGLRIPGLTEAQVNQFWSLSWHMSLAGAVERLMAILLHITLSTLVWLSIRKKTFLWLLAAIAWHTLVDFMVVFASSTCWSIWAVEGLLAGISLLNLGILWFTRQSEVVEPSLI